MPGKWTFQQESPPAWTQEAYRPLRSHSNFLLLRTEGGVPWQKIFFPVWTCIKPNLVSKFFPFTGGGGGPLTTIFFPSLNMYQAKSGVKNFSLYWGGGGGSLDKNFFSQSEHVWSQIWCQKCFPLLGGGPSTKIFFRSEHVSSQIWCQNFFPLLRLGTPAPPQKSETWDSPLGKSETWDPPCPKIWDHGTLPPTWTWTWDPPTLKVWTDTQTGVKTLPSLVLRTLAVAIVYFVSQKYLSLDVDHCYFENPCSANSECSNDIDNMEAVCVCHPGYGGETCQCKW